MKKFLLIAFLSTCTFSAFAQSTQKPQLLKYVSTDPNGDVVCTVIDDSRKSSLSIEFVDEFYKYELIHLKTGERVLSLKNKGKRGTIDKSKLEAGDYNLLIYTKSFIIGSEITVQPAMTTQSAVAMNDLEDN